MSLPQLILDDRSYQQLRDELVRRIPVYAPEWTDHNPSDPGIALIELFAFLGENLLYRFNQIPESTRLEFLRLLRIPRRPAEPAAALLTLTTSQSAGVLVEQGSEAQAGSVKFTTQTEVRVLPVSCLAVSKQRSAPPDPTDEAERELSDMVEHVLTVLKQTDPDLAGASPSHYETVSVSGPGGLPVDFAQSIDGMLWVAVRAAGDSDPNETRRRLIQHESAPLLLNLGFVPDQAPPGHEEIQPCPGSVGGESAPAVEWQISTRRFRENLLTQPIYRRLRVRGDTTAGLTREGVVRLELPTRLEDASLFDLQAEPELAGAGELPPRLDDDTKTLFWLRAYRPDKSDFGKVVFVGANATQVAQWSRAGLEFLGTGNGQSHQTFKLIHSPVIPGSLALQVETVRDLWETWTEVDGFHASRESDHHYVLDRDSGEVSFGNGLRGSAPQIGQRIRAQTYCYGGGAAGNVAAGAITKLSRPQVKATNPFPASGGSEAEPIEQALERIPGELRRRHRAVTVGDFQEFALMTPGADVGRAECLPRFEPRTRQTDAAGVVTVVIWPRHDPQHPQSPTPDRNLLRRVCRWLDERRLVTTELFVVAPRYRKIAVSIGLSVKPGYGIDAVRLWVETVIRQYLAPLPPFGPEGAGWPLGRRIYGPELEAAALQVEGVEFLEGLEVARWEEPTQDWVPGAVELELDETPQLERITVVQGQPLPVDQELQPDLPPDVVIPIPVIREQC